MLFSSSHSQFRNDACELHLNNEIIESVDSFKYLGVEIERHLGFNLHTSAICKRVNQRTGLMWRVRPFISKSLAQYLYTSLIHPHFSYCDYIYDACNTTQARKLQVAQNNALRAVLNVDLRFSATKLHADTGITELSESHKKSTCIEVYKAVNGLSTVAMSNMFWARPVVRELRSNYAVPLVIERNKLQLSDGDIGKRGIKYWTQLTTDLKSASTLAIFKSNIKNFNFTYT